MQSLYIKEIPEFLKKDYSRKSSVWVKNLIFIQNKVCEIKKWILQKNSTHTRQVKIIRSYTHSDKQEASQKLNSLEKLREYLFHYYSIQNSELQNYYTNYETDRTPTYQTEIHHPTKTITRMLTGTVNKEDLKQLQEEMDQYNIEIHVSYPLNGEVAFVTTKNKTRG